jgi:hypothetical protein
MKRLLSVWLLFFAMIAFPPPVLGDEILDLKEKIIDLQNKGSLGFQNFTLCSKIFGFGSYVPLEQPVVDKNGSLLVYYEPSNVYTSRKEGLYEIWYTQDMVLLDGKGEVVQEWKDILEFHYTTRKPVLDLFARNSLDLGGQLPPGSYGFRAVIKDKLGDKKAEKTVTFEIR